MADKINFKKLEYFKRAMIERGLKRDYTMLPIVKEQGYKITTDFKSLMALKESFALMELTHIVKEVLEFNIEVLVKREPRMLMLYIKATNKDSKLLKIDDIMMDPPVIGKVAKFKTIGVEVAKIIAIGFSDTVSMDFMKEFDIVEDSNFIM